MQVFRNSFKMWFIHRSPSDSKYPPVSRTLLSILADLHNAMFSIVSNLFLIFNSPKLFPGFCGPF